MSIRISLAAAAVILLGIASSAVHAQPASTEPAVELPPPAPELPATAAAPPTWVPEIPFPRPATTAPVTATTARAPFSYPRTAPASAASVTSQPGNSEQMNRMIITSDLHRTRDQIAPSLGAVTYTIGPDQIQNTPQGQDAPFQQVLLRAPGVAQDSFGQEHVRGEHANLTYRVNGVLLPQPISQFGQELDTHLIQSVTLIDGTLPAQFGFHTAGIIDVTTKSGQSLQGGEVAMYGGSYSTFEPSFEYGGTDGKLDYLVTASYKHSDFGIENTTGSLRPIHDATDQQHAFTYLSYHLDDTSRLSLLLNASNADFQLPDTSGLPPTFTLTGAPAENSQSIDENQNEQEYYAVAAYQKTAGDLSFQLSAFTRYGQIDFRPDPVGDLIFQGVAGAVYNNFVTNGIQFDSADVLNEEHTIRAGLIADYTTEAQNTHTLVFPVDAGAQTSGQPFSIANDTNNHAWEAGVYLQDEWRINPKLTLNCGARYDQFIANFDNEGQLSPRANLVYKIDDKTTAHAGYARYFVPPPVQNVMLASVNKFNGSSNGASVLASNPPKVERSNYYDVGISRQVFQPLTVGLDGFYKDAHNLVDLGQFGQAVIESPFNYHRGKVYGAELSSTYRENGFSAFGNLAWTQTAAKEITSQQFEFNPDELSYIDSHYIKLDHESEVTASTGIAYAWRNDMVYTDMLYGSGLRAGFANTSKVHPNYPVNAGYQHVFHPFRTDRQSVTLRFDIINVFDQVYELRDGSGIGVGAPQYGQRRSLLVGLAYDF
ncbi:MAG: TonB-dependent receptor [Phycisphaerae bacterium]|nr:TonB-dependent receptor [Phycisphaerae bacterium]